MLRNVGHGSVAKRAELSRAGAPLRLVPGLDMLTPAASDTFEETRRAPSARSVPDSCVAFGTRAVSVLGKCKADVGPTRTNSVQHRSNLAEPNLAEILPNAVEVARVRVKWTDLRSDSNEFGKTWSNFENISAELDPISAEFDQTWPRIGQI